MTGSTSSSLERLNETDKEQDMNTTDTLKITAPQGTQNIEMTREFNATREQLLAAHTDPELYAKWVGPKGYEMTITQFEPRHGGAYAFEHRNPEGNDFEFRGVFHGEPTRRWLQPDLRVPRRSG